MFLFILEDGDVVKLDNYTVSHVDACKSGILDMIDIRNPDNPLRYDGGYGQWVEVETCTG